MNKTALYAATCLLAHQLLFSSQKTLFESKHPIPKKFQIILNQLTENQLTARVLAHNAFEDYKASYTTFLAANLAQNRPMADCKPKDLLANFHEICNQPPIKPKKLTATTAQQESDETNHRNHIEKNMIASRLIFAYLNYQSTHELLLKINRDIRDLLDFQLNEQTMNMVIKKENLQKEEWQAFLTAASLNIAPSNLQ